MPRLWNETIAAHRRDVHEAILDTTAALVARHGLRSVTMAQIADEAGIGRATLYKYFSGVEAILIAWHARHVTRHLDHLAAARDHAAEPGERLAAVFAAYAQMRYTRPRSDDIAALLHRGEHAIEAQRQLSDFIVTLLSESAAAGDIRDDVPVDELAAFCLHALDAAGSLSSQVAVQRLVSVTLSALRSPHGAASGHPR